MQSHSSLQEEEEFYTDGIREYADLFGGPAVQGTVSPKNVRIELPSGPATVDIRLVTSISSEQEGLRIATSSQQPATGSDASQQEEVLNGVSSHCAATSPRLLSIDNAHDLPDSNTRLNVQFQVQELSSSQLRERMSNWTSSESHVGERSTHKHESNSESPGSRGSDARIALSSQAPEVEPSQLPEYVNRQLLLRTGTLAGLHPVIIDTRQEDARSEVVRRLDPIVATDITRRLKFSGAMNVQKASRPAFRRSIITSLRPAFLRPRLIPPNSLVEILKTVARDGDLSLVKAAIALVGEPIFETPKQDYCKEALEGAISKGHTDVVDYLLWRGVELTEDWHARSPVQKRQHKDLHRTVNYAVLQAVQARQIALAMHLLIAHKANAFLPGQPGFSEGGLYPSTPFAAVVKMKNEKDAIKLLRHIFGVFNFQRACTAGTVDGSSLVPSQMPRMLCESLLYCIKVARADVAELLLNSQATKPYVVVLMQNEPDLIRLNFEIRAFELTTWDRNSTRTFRRLRIFKNLAKRSNYLKAREHNFMSNILSDALDKVMRQAVVVDSADGVDTILNIDSALLKKRLSENGSTVSPLALAILNDAPRAAEVLLKNGAHPNDWARDGKTALQVAVRRAGTGSMAAQTILVSMLEFVSDLIPVALRNTVKTGNPQLVSSILSLMSDSSTVQNTPPDPLYDFVLALKNKRKDQMNRQNQLEIIDMLHAWDSTLALPHAHTQAVQYAIKFDNYAALEKLLSLGVVNMESLPEVLQWCIRTDQELKWQNLLKLYGTLELL